MSKSKPGNEAVPIEPVQTIEKHELLYWGPLPHPEILRQFGSVDQSYPERIMKMAEENNKAENTMKNRYSLSTLISPIIGQIMSFLISCLGFGTAIFFAVSGVETAAIAATIGGIAPIVIAALSNFHKKGTE
jgi:uncharacterized membrane protein